ncbi:MAG TPA: RHS repeat-associated core domain-containing protein [Verrucomicrobiae bacterium]|nr:RHS repeat-associated core domain-containing protein [Verrucomicrobiae bacterium]
MRRSPFQTPKPCLWGTDLSGSPQGAGGVGGLLEVSAISNSQITNCFAAFDGNGNVLGLVNAADGTLAAQYDYGPFGEVIRATGPMAKANPFRFSTKYQDDETDLVYYGYRYYNANTGRWSSRDPVVDPGWNPGLFDSLLAKSARLIDDYPNLSCFIGNKPITSFDVLGLCDPGAKCGMDVGNALNQTRELMISQFKNLPSRAQKWRNCEPYHALMYDWTDVPALFRGIYSWDLDAMTWLWGNYMKGRSCGDCPQTVTINNKCYNAWNANYYSFGVICRECGMTFRDIRIIINTWKTFNFTKWFDDSEAAIQFADWGLLKANANGIRVTEQNDLTKQCSPCSEKYTGTLGSVWPEKNP